MRCSLESTFDFQLISNKIKEISHTKGKVSSSESSGFAMVPQNLQYTHLRPTFCALGLDLNLYIIRKLCCSRLQNAVNEMAVIMHISNGHLILASMT